MQNKRIAIVTGAARGIGKAIAARLASEGRRVALVDYDREALEAAALDIGGRRDCLPVCADVSDAGAIESAIQRVAEEMGPPSILVNNAGSARDQPLQLMTVDDWDSVLNVHLRAAFLACRAIRPHLLANRWGRIVNISSISGRGHPDRVNYCSAKAGLEGLTRALAIELGPVGVTVNAIAPGLIVTRMTENTAARLGRSLADHVQRAAATLPVRRTGTPDDIAAPTAFFCSEEAGFITGQTLYAAGGPV